MELKSSSHPKKTGGSASTRPNGYLFGESSMNTSPIHHRRNSASRRPPTTPETARFRPELLLPLFWQGRLLPAFWTVGSFFSLALNVILIVALVLLVQQLFTIKNLVQNQLIGGLYSNFVRMDQASIVTTVQVDTTIQVQDTIQVNDKIPVVFNLPLNQKTEVVLTKDADIGNATVYLNGSAVNMPIILQKGTRLNIGLDLTVPVSQTVPVVLNVPVNLDVPVHLSVPVNIPLNQTELHQPFTGLQEVVQPYNQALASLPNSWMETPFCQEAEWLCEWWFK
jgi:hypothetical protein